MRTNSGQLITGLMNDGSDNSNNDQVWDPTKPIPLAKPPQDPNGGPGPEDAWTMTGDSGSDSGNTPPSGSTPSGPDNLSPSDKANYDAWSKQNPGISYADSPWGNPNAPGGLGNGNTGNDGITAATPSAGPNPPASGPPKDYSVLAGYGFDPQRANNPKDVDGKYKFGRWLVDNGYIGGGKQYNADAVRAFVAANPDEWEIMNPNSNDPLIRQKQAWLDDPKNGDNKSGQRSTWQDVIGDSGPGGANRIQFGNADGDPAQGFAGTGGAGGSSGGVGGSNPTGQVNTDVSTDLKSLLQKYYGSAYSPMRTIFGTNLSGHEGQ